MSATGLTTADRYAKSLVSPVEVERRHRPPTWWRQSLANGVLGAALWHVERARTDRGAWQVAHDWLRYAAAGPIDDGPSSHLHYGAPALAYVLHHASTARPGSYLTALEALDAGIGAATSVRVDAAHRRIDAGHAPALAEFDAIRGLTGLGAYWLRRNPDGPHLRRILDYLVRLTEPIGVPRELPGWWTHLAPNGRRTAEFPGGHANNGLSHGIAGPLALLALATRADIHVPGQATGIHRILNWFDTCQHTHAGQVGWPYWITTARLDNPGGAQPPPGEKPSRPSWCYGAPGIARAQHLAGIALNDQRRVHAAEKALLAALTAPELDSQLRDVGLCHGLAGALLIVRRAVIDSDAGRLTEHLRALRDLLAASCIEQSSPECGIGLLDGVPGTALALHDDSPSGWDTCLLTS